jgi:hypothetical protein
MRTIPIIAQKNGFDKVIETLRTEIQKLTWIGKTYPAVFRGIKDSLNVPQVYQNNGTNESLIIIPCNEEKSIVFFEKLRAAINKDTDIYDTYTMNLICWYNLKAIAPATQYDFQEDLISDILTVIQKYEISNITVNYQYLFENYNFISRPKNQFLMYPFGCFLINFNILSFC